VNRPYHRIATTDMIAGWRVSCGNSWITPRISPGASVQFISSRFAVSDVDGINFAMMKRLQCS
jgi:hypothetical protein